MPERLPAALRRRPPPAALAWVAGAVGPEARIVGVRRLRGGLSSAIHAVAIEMPDGRRHRLVLRRFVRVDWLAREPDLAEREARVLRALEAVDLPAPSLVAVDATGEACDVPSLLMQRLPGRPDLTPAGLERQIDVLAALLPRLHAVPCGAVEGLQRYRPYSDLRRAQPPPWTGRPEVWRRLIDVVAQPAPPGPRALIHRDFHPGNVLWSRGRLSGIIDWVSASCGSPAADVAHCRLNLVRLAGLEAAERFRAAYEAAAGVPQPVYWDVVALLDHDLARAPDLSQAHDAGRTDLTTGVVCRRLDAYAARLADRL